MPNGGWAISRCCCARSKADGANRHTKITLALPQTVLRVNRSFSFALLVQINSIERDAHGATSTTSYGNPTDVSYLHRASSINWRIAHYFVQFIYSFIHSYIHTYIHTYIYIHTYVHAYIDTWTCIEYFLHLLSVLVDCLSTPHLISFHSSNARQKSILPFR